MRGEKGDWPDVGKVLSAFQILIRSACKEELNRPDTDSMRDALATIISCALRLWKLMGSDARAH